MVEVMRIMVTSFKRFLAYTAILSVPSPAAGHHQPTPPLETPGYSLASLGQFLVGSLLLSPGSWCAQGSVWALKTRVYFPVLCKSGSSMVGLMATSSKMAYAIPRSAALRGPATAVGHYRAVPPEETLKQFWLCLCGVSGSWCTQGLFESSECSWWVWGLILNEISPLLPSCSGFSFALEHGVSPQSHSSATQPLLQHLPSWWDFSVLGSGVSPQSCSSTTQPPLYLSG